MKRIIFLLTLFLIIMIPLLLGMSMGRQKDVPLKKSMIEIEEIPNLEIQEGFLSQKKETISVYNDQKRVGLIQLSEPVIVAQAEQEEGWGYFQFPVLAETSDGALIVDWQMKEDSHTTYGMGTESKHTPMYSKDEGLTWHPYLKGNAAVLDDYKAVLRDGSVIQVYTPKAEDITSYNENLVAVASTQNYVYYKMEDLPEKLKGVYIIHWDANLKSNKKIHAALNDKGALRYSIDGLMPIVWWGNMKELENGNLIAGTYPSNYLDDKGNLLPTGVSFYKSEDRGYTWDLIGKIPYQPDYNRDPVARYKADKCFEEPAFEILSDSTFLCVMRTGGASPMYKTFSKDRGKTWSKPEPFTPNGVKPMLLSLKNGVLVLASGRPGVQIRFSLDGLGHTWTQPLEMMPFMNKEKYDQYVSCSYTSMIEAGDDSFYIVYSDFKRKNQKGEYRKAIMFRKITVKQL